MDKRYQLSPNIDIQPLDDQLMVLDLAQNAYFSLNESARFLIERIAEGKSIREIIDEALDAFEDVSASLLADDFNSTLAEFLELGFIVEK
ncbi:MAG: PqqD family protein [Proteobacteria bacterium]|nr:PqqD family protein [Pseudomonadota bacterium]